MVETEEHLWNLIAMECQEQYGMSRTKASLPAKWTMFTLNELSNECYIQACNMKHTSNLQPKLLHKLSNALFQRHPQK